MNDKQIIQKRIAKLLFELVPGEMPASQATRIAAAGAEVAVESFLEMLRDESEAEGKEDSDVPF